MILDSSRYSKVAQDETVTRDGRRVTALRLRALPPTAGEPFEVREHDRLDLLAQSSFGDGTRFWQIADANSALEARDLTAVVGDTLRLPPG
jgi:hypothetical protein